jgi:exodeoxyribonuclease III
MKVISWNVNGIRAIERKGAFYELLKLNADVLCLQETKAELSQMSNSVISPEGYSSFFYSSNVRKGHAGVAIYSKEQPDLVVYGGIRSGEEFDQEGRVITAYFENLVIINIYFPNGADRSHHEAGGGLEYKLDFYKTVSREAESIRKSHNNIIICGDFNVAHAEIDLARPKENKNSIGFLPVEREWLTSVLEMGWVDTFRTLHPETISYTWWDVITRARDRNVGWRIDYQVVTPDLFKTVVSCENMNDFMGSDHCPVSLEFTIK